MKILRWLGFFAAALIAAIILNTSTGDLHGTELLPDGAGPHPVVLIIAGSGPTDREGNNPLIPGRNDSLKMLGEGLVAKGIASVRYDKRGIAASAKAGSREDDLRFEHYVDDHMRNIPDHYHAHARPKGGFFGHGLKRTT